MQFKDNYFGYYQKYTTMSSGESTPAAQAKTQAVPEEERFDPRKYRPLSVKVALTLHDIHGHLVKVHVGLRPYYEMLSRFDKVHAVRHSWCSLVLLFARSIQFWNSQCLKMPCELCIVSSVLSCFCVSATNRSVTPAACFS